MNILMALSQLEVTGAEVYATTLGQALADKGHQLFYVSDTLTKSHPGPFFRLRFNKRNIFQRFWHVSYLVYLIKKHRVQLVHAHSRASSWSCHIACRLTGTPMVTSVHGRQPVHASRKRFHAMGDLALPVCESIATQLVEELGVDEKHIQISRNGIDTQCYQMVSAPNHDKKVIAIIGRLSGPKGDLCYRLLKESLDLDQYQVRIISGTPPDHRFDAFRDQVEFVGYVDDVPSVMKAADLVIGAGRVAMEALLCGRPTLAIGEAINIGLVNSDNLAQAMGTNFGDVGPKILDIDFSCIAAQVAEGVAQTHCDPEISAQIRAHYDLEQVCAQIDSIYQSVFVTKKRREIPVLMYHRFIDTVDDQGRFAPYIDIKRFESHLKLLKTLGFQTLTFEDLAERGLSSRLSPSQKYCILTVDDGYVDNLTLMLPLLEKYQMKAVVYVVTGRKVNQWDIDHPHQSEKPFSLMNDAQIKTMSESPWIEIGGHTLTHPHLNTLSESDQYREIAENKAQLERLTGKPLTSFAYPYGDWNDASQSIVQSLGYRFAVATNSGPLQLHEAPFLIRRIGVFPGTDQFGFLKKISGRYLFRKHGRKMDG